MASTTFTTPARKRNFKKGDLLESLTAVVFKDSASVGEVCLIKRGGIYRVTSTTMEGGPAVFLAGLDTKFPYRSERSRKIRPAKSDFTAMLRGLRSPIDA